ncbi:MAG: hypothetical protein PWP23_1432 [Candidatus Sumerlaeota bacterium]|nr:hypothetical protein [Candidatus Sumerlaeota bacterium]
MARFRTAKMALVAGSVLLAVAAAFLATRGNSHLSRDPYVQMLSPTSALVRWRTVGTGLVQFETVNESTGKRTSRPVTHVGGEYEARLTGLTPFTDYEYRIYSGLGPARRRLEHGEFKTAPAGPAPRPVDIWVLGCSGNANDVVERVRDAYLAHTASRPDMMLLLGDNAYYYGTDEEYQAGLFKPFGNVLTNVPVWPVIGNHDKKHLAVWQGTGPYFDIFTLPAAGECGGVPSGNEVYYSFDYGEIHVIALYSETDDQGILDPMLDWAARDLAASTARWKIAMMHRPPYSPGEGEEEGGEESDERLILMREQVAPVLEAGGVDLVLSAHTHVYARSYLLSGRTAAPELATPESIVDRGSKEEFEGAPTWVFRPDGRGTLYVVMGSSSKLEGGEGNDPALADIHLENGSLALRVADGWLLGEFITQHGVLEDRFALLKP